MLANLILGSLIASPMQTQDPTMPDQSKEAFGKGVSTAEALGSEGPSLGFHKGACLLGGYLKQGGQFTFNIVINEPSDYAALVGTYGNDFEVEVTVKEPTGKNTVVDRDEKGSLFEAKTKGRYGITAKNKGAATFVGLALVRETGGVTHSFPGINTASTGIANGIKDSFKDGYGAHVNKLMVLGSIIGAGANSAQTTTYNFPRWMILAGSDAGPKSFQLSVKNPANSQTIVGSEDKTFSYCEYDQPITNAQVVIKNTGAKKILAMQALLH